jgi:glucose/arabinose dehydrogenase
LIIAFAIGALATSNANAQVIHTQWRDQLTLSDIGTGIIQSPSRTTQMALTEGPTSETRYLYMSSNTRGIRRVTYDLSSRSLVAGSLESVASDINGLGIAFDGDTLYATEFYTSDADGSVELSRLWRIEDKGFGTRTEIVQGIPRQDHGVNNIQIIDHTLYVGIGVRTRNGVFDTWNGDHYGESAYGGSIAVIDDLRQVGPEENAAGFYPGHPTAAQYEQLINGQDPLSASPYTTENAGKLRVHSSGTRNPFGLAIDGDGQVWFTNNFHRTENDVYDRDNLTDPDGDNFGGDGFQDDIHDQLFKAVPMADYGYRNGNWQDGNAAGNTAAVNAGFFAPQNRTHSFTFDNYVDPVATGDNDDQNSAFNQDHQVVLPVGLGPSSSANGFTFYQANDFPLALHQDAFIARYNGRIQDGIGEARDILEYRDVVSVDSDTGEVQRIAGGFRNPLAVTEDGQGNLLVADHDGSIFLISATTPVTAPHPFTWDSDQSGVWSDRLTWNADSMAEDDRMVPHEWGTARYAVTIDRANADVTLALDRDARVESVQLAERLELTEGQSLSVDSQMDVLASGQLAGSGALLGLLVNQGQLIPGSASGPMSVSSFQQDATGRLVIDLRTNLTGALLQVTQDAQLSGQLQLLVDLSSLERDSTLAADVVTAAAISGDFSQYVVNGLVVGGDGHIANGSFLRSDVTPTTAHVSIYTALPGDADGNGLFDSSDLIQVFQIGQYEDALVGNSDWPAGDWDGNQDFDSSDIVLSMQTGNYIATAQPIPEPTAEVLGLLGSWALTWPSRSARRHGYASP